MLRRVMVADNLTTDLTDDPYAILQWRCECGGMFPGRAGYGELLNHLKESKGEEGHAFNGAYHAETGEYLGGNFRQVNKALGVVSPPPGRRARARLGDAVPGKPPKSPVRVYLPPKSFELDPVLELLYVWDRTIRPDYTATFPEWLKDCVLIVHSVYADTLDMGRLLSDKDRQAVLGGLKES
jgi:hypothetical protein